MKFQIEKSKIQEAKGTTLVLFATSRPETSERGKVAVGARKRKKLHEESGPWSIAGLSPDLDRLLNTMPKGRFSGKAGESVFFRACALHQFENLLLVGLGELQKDNYELLRIAISHAVRLAVAERVGELTLALDPLQAYFTASKSVAQALCEGALLSEQGPHLISTKKSDEGKKPELSSINLIYENSFDEKELKEGLRVGRSLAEAVLFARYLGDLPGNYLNPTQLGREVQKAAKGLKGVKVTVWDKARIKKERMGGLLGVASGSDQPPTFTIIEYHGAAKKNDHIAFVGKGLTFDSGGISIKPAAAMEEMKFDMCGGATVIAAVLALAKLGAEVNATAYVPSTENLSGGSAIKPGDILTFRNGKTVEVNNTDAEGRLILADALVYASEQKPKAILDAATLTGAMVIALGNTHTGFFSKFDELVQSLEKAAKTTGELVWRMPLIDAHSADMVGTFADLSNISSARGAGSATAAAFLEHFVDKKIPWAHFDIAGTAQNLGGRLPYCPAKGASGAMVRTFVEVAQSL